MNEYKIKIIKVTNKIVVTTELGDRVTKTAYPDLDSAILGCSKLANDGMCVELKGDPELLALL